MHVAMMIQKFSKITELPVQVKLVETYIKECKIVDTIEYVGVDINAEVLRGMNIITKRDTTPGVGFGMPTFHADIYYANSLPPDEKRLGQCKELITF
jgi:hypothetical protein